MGVVKAQRARTQQGWRARGEVMTAAEVSELLRMPLSTVRAGPARRASGLPIWANLAITALADRRAPRQLNGREGRRAPAHDAGAQADA
jgi:hypothetical protein